MLKKHLVLALKLNIYSILPDGAMIGVHKLQELCKKGYKIINLAKNQKNSWQINFTYYIYRTNKTMKFNSAYFYGYYFYFTSKSRD